MADENNMTEQAKEESNITKKEPEQLDVPFTQVPNQIMDTMPLRTPAENLVLFAICRKTYGWKKTRDQISISQIMKLTGISKQGVLNCLKSLKANLWIQSDKDDYGNIIYIPLKKTKEDLLIPRIEPEKWKKISDRSKPANSGRQSGQTIRLVKSVDRSNHLTVGGQTSLPENSENRSNHLTGGSQTIGHTKETLNKEKEEIKDKESKTVPPTVQPESLSPKITIGNFRDMFIQKHKEFSPKSTQAGKETADTKIMPYDDLQCEQRMEELISLARKYDEIISRNSELTSWYKNKGFNVAMPVSITYLTRKKNDIEDAFSSLPQAGSAPLTAAQRDKLGGDDSTVQKIVNESIKRGEISVEEYLASGGQLF